MEIKAKCNDLDHIRTILKGKGADFKGEDHQIDTYFNCNNGRLKLRSGKIENSLIFYRRKNMHGFKDSYVTLQRLSKDNSMKELLSDANGILVEVDKKREIFFIGNIKFHVDQVKGLGTFVEIEAIDLNGDIGREKLNNQCDTFIKLFDLDDIDFVDCSYSDLILLNKNRHYKEFVSSASVFLNDLFNEIDATGILIEDNFCDHICYRVSDIQEYYKMKTKLATFSELLGESLVGGRKIATYKLISPIIFRGRKIDIVELPSAKSNNLYKEGFEHLEFVIAESFDEYIAKYPEKEFDLSGTKKDFNPELRLRLASGRSVKFHHLSLERVIEIETSRNE